MSMDREPRVRARSRREVRTGGASKMNDPKKTGSGSSRILYITYDGVLEPLGESQVIGYLERLAPDHDITLLSFEKRQDLSDRSRVLAMQRRLEAHRITWVRSKYHKRPSVLSTVFDVIAGTLRARAQCRRHAGTIVHARSYVPALIALGARGASGARFLFDMRGFWVDEKVEAGHWRAGGLLYRIGKRWERRFFASADALVSLTEEGVRTLPQLGYTVPPSVIVEVIPTCVDLERFTPGDKDPKLVEALGLVGATVIGCIGTMSNWYMRDDMLRYLSRLAKTLDRLRILIVTREDHEELRRDAERAGVPRDRLVITRADFTDMPRFIRLFDGGLFFIRPALSKRGSAATKLAEFLACGVPVIINAGVGDSGEIVREGRVGALLPAVDEESLERSLPDVRALLADRAIGDRCRQVARLRFDVEKGVKQYRRVYERLRQQPRLQHADRC